MNRATLTFLMIGVVGISLIPVDACGQTPADALLLLGRQGQLQLWWPEDSQLVNIDLLQDLQIRDPAPFQDVVAGPPGIFVLDRRGRVYSLFERRLIFEPPFQDAIGEDLLIDRSGAILWILDRTGCLYRSNLVHAATSHSRTFRSSF